jgi:hypothetical protein
MDRVPVSSSSIASVGYDPDSRTLEVEFRKGGIYQYFRVPKDVHEDLMGSSSKGQYHHQNIKNRYPSTRIG